MITMISRIKRIVQEVSHAETLKDAMQIMVENIVEILPIDACSVFLVNEEQQHYILVAHLGFLHPDHQPITIKFGQGLVGWVGQHEEPLNLENAIAHPHYHYIAQTGEEQFLAFLGVPIIHRSKLLGVLVVQQRSARRFTEEEEAFLVTMSAELASFIAHAQATDSLLVNAQLAEKKETYLTGIAAATGIGMGKIVTVYPRADLTTVPHRTIQDIPAEIELLHKALQATRDEIDVLAQRLSDKLSPEELGLFDAYLKIITSPSLTEEVEKIIAKGLWAQGAWCQVIQKHIAQFAEMENEYFQERVSDLRDLGQRVLAHLQTRNAKLIDYPLHTILVGEEVTATELAAVPSGQLAGIVSLKGSRNSHLAILARAMGVPTVMAVTGLVPHKLEGQPIIIDGHLGRVYINPTLALQKKFSEMQQEEQQLNKELLTLSQQPSETKDGYVLPININAGLGLDIPDFNAMGASGVGLYRTEILFMTRDSFPSETQQYEAYLKLLRGCHPYPVAIRTLDIGGDKILPYFTITEDNPFLGWRGIRVALDHPEIFLMQIRAMLRASVGLNNLQIILPMISNLQELLTALGLINRAWYEVSEKCPSLKIPKIGAMIEVPAAVYQAEEIAKHVDFLSIGTNDLTQYLLAVDRNNPRVIDLFDHLHPAVLLAIQQVIKGGHAANRHVSVCGEMAADPLAVIILLAFGIDSLSMNANTVLRIKWLIRSLSLSRAREIWQDVKSMQDAMTIRTYLIQMLVEMGLQKLL